MGICNVRFPLLSTRHPLSIVGIDRHLNMIGFHDIDKAVFVRFIQCIFLLFRVI
jgi:hypothetical protein